MTGAGGASSRRYESAELSEAAQAAMGVSDYSGDGWLPMWRMPSIDGFDDAAVQGIPADEKEPKVGVVRDLQGRTAEMGHEAGDEAARALGLGAQETAAPDIQAVAPQIMEF